MLGLDQVLSCASPLAVSILLCPSDNKVDCTHHSRTHPFALTAPRPAAMSACDCPTFQPLENSGSPASHLCTMQQKRDKHPAYSWNSLPSFHCQSNDFPAAPVASMCS